VEWLQRFARAYAAAYATLRRVAVQRGQLEGGGMPPFAVYVARSIADAARSLAPVLALSCAARVCRWRCYRLRQRCFFFYSDLHAARLRCAAGAPAQAEVFTHLLRMHA